MTATATQSWAGAAHLTAAFYPHFNCDAFLKTCYC